MTKPKASPTLLVRLKPYDKRRRHVMKIYVHGPSSKKFEERKGWYKVDEESRRGFGLGHRLILMTRASVVYPTA